MLSQFLLATAVAAGPLSAPATDAFRFEQLQVRDRIEADGHARRTIDVVVLLRTPAAVQHFGQIGSPYVDGYGEVSFENIRVQKPSGSWKPVEDGRIEDLNPFGINDAAIPVDVRIRKLTLPGLEPGDRLAYTMVATSRPFVPGEAYGEMKFSEVPVDGPQVYELDIPATSRLIVNLRPDLGVSWEVVPGPEDRLVRRLSVTVRPTVVANTGLTEAQLAALQTPDVSYSTFASWSKVGEWWWAMSRERVEGDETTKREAARIVAGRKTPRDKIEAIASFVSTGIRYLNVGFGIGRMQPRQAASVLASRYGDCKDKVGLLMALAAAAGIEVRPVLIHSLRLDLVDETPGPHQFDHVVAAAILGPDEEDWLWIDPTLPLSPATTLMPSTRDKRALAIDGSGRGVIVRTPAAPPGPMRKDVTLTAVLEPAGVLRGRVRLEDRSDAEPMMRGSFASFAREQHPEMLKAVLGRTWAQARISSVKTADPAELATPFWVEFDFERDVKGVDPEKEWKLWVPDLGPVLLEASADATARKPIVFTVTEVAFKASVDLPADVTARAPLSISMERPFASLRSSYAVDGRTLVVERVVRLPLPSIAREQLPAYEALRKAAATDREQEFVIGPLRSAAPAAAALQQEGKAAYARREYAKAIELLEKALAADPKLAGAHLDLGLALRESERYEEAIAAYTKAIELDPYHDSVYAERAYALFELDRAEDAEKDLLKQMEVAPFEDWSYRRLGQLRQSQGRFEEAAALFTKSLAIDPAPVADWMDLGEAHARLGQTREARAAFAKAEQIGLGPGERTLVARGYALIGDWKAAETLATRDLPEVLEKVAAITEADFVKNVHWTDRMLTAWGVIGSAALAAGDVDKAERFLKASWEAGRSPDDGLPFATALARRGRKAEAAAVLTDVVGMRPEMFGRPEMADLFKQLGSHAVNAKVDVAGKVARGIPIVAAGLPKVFSAGVTILARDGRVAAARGFSAQQTEALAPLVDALIGSPAPWLDPQGKAATLVRHGFIGCGIAGCRWFALAENQGRPPAEPVDVGSIAMTRIAPAPDTLLVAGSTVAMKVSLDYTLEGTTDGRIVVIAADERFVPLLERPPSQVVKPGKGVTEFAFEVPVPKDTSVVRLHAILFVGAPSNTYAEAVFNVAK
jgi:tetratricopeptide (TPR) repeat protein